MGFLHIPGHNPKGRYWQGYEWSDWHLLREIVIAHPATYEEPGLIGVPGLYRLALRRAQGLLYIGQTGRSLQGRLRQHYERAEFAVGLRKRASTRPPRPMAIRLGELVKARRAVMVSWTPLERVSKADRLGIEAELIAAYRAVAGRNPDLQFLSADEDDDLGVGPD